MYVLPIISIIGLWTIGSSASFDVMLPPPPSRSTHGESGVAQAGMGSPCCFSASSIANVRPPPAESPAMAMRDPLMPFASSLRTDVRTPSSLIGMTTRPRKSIRS